MRDRLEQALAKIADPKGEGARACLTVYAETARAAADAADARAKAGISLGPLDGTIVTIKDLFDVEGEPTRAGSRRSSADAQPAAADAPVVRRLRAAGAVIVAKTNMSEFAFSGVGINPHYGTPGNPADRTRVPGGSSSGAAVAAADQMCEIAIGTDTGGSCRIPAALCGIVGFKPSKQRVPTDGAFPLSFTLDFDRADGAHGRGLRARPTRSWPARSPRRSQPAPVAGLRLGIPQGFLTDRMGQHSRHALRRRAQEALAMPARASPMSRCRWSTRCSTVNAKGGLRRRRPSRSIASGSRKRADEFDPNVRVRIERGGNVTAADYIDMMRARARLVRAMDAQLSGLRCLDDADDADRGADHRRDAGHAHVQHQEHAAAAQYADLEFLRQLRDLDADSGQRLAGRADAGRAQRP